jgi:hypothetical protein
MEKITDEEVLGGFQWKYTQKLQKPCYQYIFFGFYFCFEMQIAIDNEILKFSTQTTCI